MVIHIGHVARRLWWMLIPHRFESSGLFGGTCDRCGRSREGWH